MSDAITILYVEDDDEVRGVLSDFLKRRFEKVITAKDGEEGLTRFIQHRPDLVITDVRMPKKNGIEMIHSIRNVDSSTPILVLSAYADQDFLTESVRSKIDGHLLKPVDERAFFALVDKVLGGHDPVEPADPEIVVTDEGEEERSIAPRYNADDMLVVGIGASAGGLEALSAMVAGLPEQNNTAYLVAQHLSPNHKTMLVDLLSRATQLPIKDAEHGETITRDTIYVTPPNKNIEVSADGRILLSAPEKYSFLPKPSVNQLFLSLAEHKKEMAMGVILSGTGSDGAQGMRAINAAGGITIVQEPGSAKYDGMPMASINGCSVDLVIDPGQIGEELVALANFPRQKVLQKYQLTQANDEMSTIFELLYRYKKVDFSVYKKTTIARRIERRMLTLKLTSLSDYVERLTNDSHEVVLLYKDILIGVTSFFRDREAFDALHKHLGDYLDQNPELEEFRVWITGASTGEEAYSIIITLKELMLERRISLPIRAFATDIDEDALKMARRGMYSEASTSEIGEAEIQRYFTISENEFEVKKLVREHVVFSFHNLLADPPFKNVDLVVCRNLLIYFTGEAQRHIMPLFHYALKAGGILFLGKSENATNFEHMFATLNRTAKIFRQVPSAQREYTVGLRPPSYAQKRYVEQRRETAKPAPLHEKVIAEAVKVLLPNIIVINEQFDIVYKKGDLDYLTLGDGYLSFNLFKMIDPRLAIDMRNTIVKAKRDEAPVSSDFISLTDEEHGARLIRAFVVPLLAERQELYVLYFHELSEQELPRIGDLRQEGALVQERPLELELQRTREHMQTLVEELETSNEELQSTNEELQSANEELQSTNEELETSNEELQSTNEELQTAYAELKEMYQANNSIKEELSSLSGRYETVLESINEAVVVSTLDGVFVRTNRAMQRITGLNRDSLLAKSWHEVAGESEELIRQRRLEVIDQGRCGPYLLSLISNTDAHYILSVQDYLIRDDGGVHQVWSFATDVTAEHEAKQALELNQQKYKTVFDRANVGIARVAINGAWIDANERVCNLLGYGEEELRGITLQQITHPDDLDKELEWLQKLRDGIASDYKLEKRYLREDGSILWVKQSVTLVRDSSGTPRLYLVVVEDIDDLKRSLLHMEQTAVVFNATQDAIIVTDKDARVTSVNSAFEAITGYTAAEVIGRPANILKSGKHPRSYYEEMWRLLRKTGIWSGEIINRNKEGELYPGFLNITAVKDAMGRTVQYVGVLTDISLLKQSQEKADFLASHDTLTGLPNRTLFMDRIDHALEQAKRTGAHIALFFVDLDRFKVINDGLGHHVGDDVLVAVAKRFKKILREQDTVARLGGDEFVVILEDIASPISAGKVAQNIIDGMSEPIESGGHSVQVGCSIGISIYPNDGITREELIRLADIAMYQAKEAGRNTYRFCSAELSSHAFEKVTLENAIRDGLKADEFEVYYQPIFDLGTLKMVHAEALIRWNHPKLGLIMPGKFIPVAEESSLIIALTEYVLYDVLTSLRIIREDRNCDCKVAVNFSVKDFESNELFAKFRQYLGQCQVEASSVILELTERMFVKGDSKQQRLFDRYEKLGVKLAIDDFGTGYSNLNSLSSMPLDYLKIDRSFVEKIGQERTSEELIKATIAIAKALGQRTIAEGIETEDQLAFLREAGCDLGQGYLLHVPKPLAELREGLANLQ